MESNPRLVVLTTAYNCDKYIEKCLDSIKSQKYTNFVCYILDDLSTDKTVKLVNKYTYPVDKRFLLSVNSEKKYQPGNYDQIIRNTTLVNDDDIIVEVDGDDYLPDDEVFNRVVGYYSNPNVWITYGQFKYTNGSMGFALPVDISKSRTDRFTVTHLRTWRAKLWKHIKPEDLKVNGKYPEAAGDIFFMLPMVEMAGKEHTLYCTDVNYIYNFDNPIGDSKGKRLEKTLKFAAIGRSRPRYTQLESL